MEESKTTAEKRLDGYVALYKAQMEHFRKTVELEWRVTFAAWTLLGVLIYAAAEKSIHFPRLAWAVFVLPLLHVGWLCLIHASEDVDKSLWVSYRRKVLDLLGHPVSEHLDSWTKRPWWKRFAWISLETGVTLLLSFVACKTLAEGA